MNNLTLDTGQSGLATAMTFTIRVSGIFLYKNMFESPSEFHRYPYPKYISNEMHLLIYENNVKGLIDSTRRCLTA